MKQFAGVRKLFGGASLSQPPEDDEDDNVQNDNGPSAGPSEAQVNKLVAEESDKARKAADARWNTVMTSDHGQANPKAAAKLLMSAGGVMTADEVIATLSDLGPAPAADADAGAADKGAKAERDKQLKADADALANDADANPDTGPAGSRPGVRKGEGESEAQATARREARAARIQKRNPKPKN